jgi:hypothetical protein
MQPRAFCNTPPISYNRTTPIHKMPHSAAATSHCQNPQANRRHALKSEWFTVTLGSTPVGTDLQVCPRFWSSLPLRVDNPSLRRIREGVRGRGNFYPHPSPLPPREHFRRGGRLCPPLLGTTQSSSPTVVFWKVTPGSCSVVTPITTVDNPSNRRIRDDGFCIKQAIASKSEWFTATLGSD